MKPGEKPEEVAMRESVEEAACEIETLYPINDYFVSPGGSNEYIHLFAGKINASSIGGVHGLVEENEDIRAFTVESEAAFDMLRQGLIKTAPAIVALQWLQINRAWLRSLWQK
jgi:ADP-ribose pyrophosphatase